MIFNSLKVTLLRIGIVGIIFFQLIPHVYAQSDYKGQLEKAKELLTKGDFKEAEILFKKVIKSQQEGLPDEVSYYYGLALFKIGKPNQSKAFIERYLAISGVKAEFYNEARNLLNELNPKICTKCNGTNEIFKFDTCTFCIGVGIVSELCKACAGKGIIRCNWCEGKGIAKKTNSFNVTNYENCYHCEAKGKLVCGLCKGTKQPNTQCKNCNGTGKIRTKIRCTH